MPAGHDADAFRKTALEHFDVSLGTGLSKVAGKVFRIGHLGDTNDLTIIGALAGVEMGLALAGVPHRKGGVQAAMDYFAGRPIRRARRRNDPLRHARVRACASNDGAASTSAAMTTKDCELSAWLWTQNPTTSRSSIRTSISGTSAATIIRGCAIPSRSRSATATIPRSSATTCRPTTCATRARSTSSRPCTRKRCGTRPIRRARRAGSSRWRQEYGYPHACVGAALFARDDIGEVLAAHAKSKLTRGVRNFPVAGRERRRGEARRAAARWTIRNGGDGYALLEKHGFSFDLQTPWWHLDAAAELARDFPNTQIIIVHTGTAGRPQRGRPRRLARGARAGRRAAECRDQDLRPRPAGPAVDARPRTAR